MKKLFAAFITALSCIVLFAACNTIPTAKTLEFHSNIEESFTFDVRRITDKTELTYGEENLGTFTLSTLICNNTDVLIDDVLFENATGALAESRLTLLNGDSVVKKAFYTTKFNTKYAFDERTVNGKYVKTTYDYRDGTKVAVFEKDEAGTVIQSAEFSAKTPELYMDSAMLYSMIGCSKITKDKDYLSAFNLSFQTFLIDNGDGFKIGSYQNLTAAVGGTFKATVPYSKADAVETYGVNIIKNNSNNLNGVPLVAFYGKEAIVIGEGENEKKLIHPLIRINEGDLAYVLTSVSVR